ncbi:MAG TPA: glycerol dehydrogenase [Syntrophomonadaceae bacterium]|nr:glycerol dehydrogenase [Syntrophomonadaceae bacterium]HOQ09453.1 glycerol dehydrogenase [Syntrophomonadaceae bacterium]HPU48277.1 glycerol dehydrogenase [Syntrophomonadaceae bacterium]
MAGNVKVMVAPGRYVQGQGAIFEIGRHVKKLGKKALVIGGKTGLASTREGREKSFAENGISQVEELFGGECSSAEIERLSNLAREKECDVIVASGGGKAIDTAKAVAAAVNARTVIVPTIASSDAPCSAMSVIYKDDGTIERFFIPPTNPDLVLVDTEIIAKAPVRMLVAGMGDALATWLEADAACQSGARNPARGLPTSAAMALARLCFDILMEYGLQAKIANERQAVTTALEKVVEANILLSGIGFESGGVAAAHSLQDGLNMLEECHDFYHGEKIGFLALVQMVLEGRPKELIQQVYEFNYKVGLPITLADLHIDNISEERLREAVAVSCKPKAIIYNHAFPITEELVFDAILTADEMGKRIKAGQPIV